MARDATGTVGSVTAAETPAIISNRPSLRAIEYRVGTYATFRRTMLRQISRWRRTAEPSPGVPLATPEAPRPLANWTTRSADDFGIAFLEMWAYLADILTFYQERIANEAFLRTAVQRQSTTLLVSLIGYRPGPGRAAVAQLAFETERDATVELPAGLLVQSVPGQGEKPQKFETVADLTAYASLNELRPRTLASQDLPRGATRAVLAGTGHDISPGDWVAIAGDERRNDPGSERWDVRRVAAVQEDDDAGTTTVSWLEGLGAPRRPGRGAVEPDEHPEFWVFRGQAWPFGYNGFDPAPSGVPVAEAYLPQDVAHPTQLFLDTVYPDIVEGGWVALVTSRVDSSHNPELAGYDEYVELYRVVASTDTAHAAFLLSGKSTQVTLDPMSPEQWAARQENAPRAVKERISRITRPAPEHIEFFPVRGTIALIQSERIPFADVPLGHSPLSAAASQARPVEGTTIELDRSYPDLRRGRTLLVTGMLVDGAGRRIGEGSEAVVVATLEPAAGRTTIRFASAMKGRYERSSVVIYGNVAVASHGESVHGEALGDGHASDEFQTFALKKQPLTYVPEPGAPGGVASTLQLRVDSVRWAEVPELYGQPPDARVYVVRRDAVQATTVRAGDGHHGARVPSGRNNVTADYRVGLGPAGNVRAGSLRTLLKKPLGLKRVTNPADAAGGADPEDPAAIQKNAPGTVRTFGRIVSIRDFEDAAREYVGIAKARASFVWDGEARVVRLVVAGDSGAHVDVAASGLLADLDTRRDPHQPLRVENFTPRPAVVRLTIAVDSAYLPHIVRRDADTALRALFAFDALELGEAVGLSDVHRAIQRVDGVVSVDVEEFRFATQARGTVEPRLLVGPNELIWIDDPDDLEVIVPGEPAGAAP
ncbi:MAG TPA: baseplate J/gp47 family protein [Candidatus Limnocylindrales bacterium]|nr:baseplate J/gp47 family protein [Candidatus Limnocylindrales bacterium]